MASLRRSAATTHFEHFLAPVFITSATAPEPVSHGPELGLAFVSLAVAVLGFLVAWQFYFRKPGTAAALAQRFRPAYSLVAHKYWVDEIYGIVIVGPLLAVSRLFLGGIVDTGLVQGTGAGLAGGTRGLGWITRRMQSGNIRSYAGWLALGAAVLIAVVLFGVHAHAQ